MSKGSRAKHARIEYGAEFEPVELPAEYQDSDPMCEQCGAYPKSSRSNLCESCEAMSAPRAWHMK